MSKPLFCFRFDVDTPLCVRRGVPALLAAGAEKGVPFTFFFNMGRAVSHRDVLRKRRSSLAQEVTKLTSKTKLGVAETLMTAVLNPWVGLGYRQHVRATLEQGHEVGLHGGRNHGTWQHGAQNWTSARIEAEVAWGKHALEDVLGAVVTAFSSPGWNGGPDVNAVLAKLGFRYAADLHGDAVDSFSTCELSRLTLVRTRLSGEPGGVGYLEWLTAAGHDDDAALECVESQLARHPPMMVLYDHPCYAGIQKLDLLLRLIDLVRDRGFTITTIANMLVHHEQQSAIS